MSPSLTKLTNVCHMNGWDKAYATFSNQASPRHGTCHACKNNKAAILPFSTKSFVLVVDLAQQCQNTLLAIRKF
jgi:hypothetical protein